MTPEMICRFTVHFSTSCSTTRSTTVWKMYIYRYWWKEQKSGIVQACEAYHRVHVRAH